ncbi:MAG: YHS domain protein [Spirochaetota bacterium]|nr:YHS domain protein [Spirochaetota bacterium]
MPKPKIIHIPIILSAIILSALSHSKSPIYSSQQGIAIKGYDTVAYFTSKKALKGSFLHRHRFNNVTWLFSNRDNLNLFKKNPWGYIPAYGGYCAYFMSFGGLAPADPSQWHIHRGRLYLANSLSTKNKWLSQINSHIKRADSHWSKLRQKP